MERKHESAGRSQARSWAGWRKETKVYPPRRGSREPIEGLLVVHLRDREVDLQHRAKQVCNAVLAVSQGGGKLHPTLEPSSRAEQSSRAVKPSSRAKQSDRAGTAEQLSRAVEPSSRAKQSSRAVKPSSRAKQSSQAVEPSSRAKQSDRAGTVDPATGAGGSKQSRQDRPGGDSGRRC